MKLLTSMLLLFASLISLGFGVALQTVWKPDAVLSVSTDTSRPNQAPLVVIDSSLLRLHPGAATISISAADTSQAGTIVAAVGQRTDIKAWSGDAQVNTLAIDPKDSNALVTRTTGTELTTPDPAGSDLWLVEHEASRFLQMSESVATGQQVLIASTGAEPAPSSITLSWKQHVSYFWIYVCYIVGGALFIAGVWTYVSAIQSARRQRRPRRGAPRPPSPRRTGKSRQQPVTHPSTSRRHGRRSSSMIALVPGALVVALVMSGCTPTTVVPSATSASPSAAPKAAVPASQIDAIVAKISDAADTADASRKIDDLANRFAGPALALREANYAIRGKDKTHPKLPAILPGPTQLVLPPSSTDWPRTAFVVVDDSTDQALPIALMLQQADPRSNYQVQYASELLPGVRFPSLPGPEVGSVSLDPSSHFVSIAPNDVAPKYYAALASGKTDSAASSGFDLTDDQYFEAVQKHRAALVKSLGKQGKVVFSNKTNVAAVMALSTSDSGAIVATYSIESETITPAQSGGSVAANGAVRALLGKSTTKKGFVANYGVMMLFSVAPTSGGKTSLLGATQGLLNATERK